MLVSLHRMPDLRLPAPARLLICVLALLLTTVSCAAMTSPASGYIYHGRHGTYAGVDPRVNQQFPRGGLALSGSSTTSNLEYHGGPVLHENTTYAIFWDPSGQFPATTKDNLVQYFKDVATDSGQHSNVYSVATQYSDSAGDLKYASTFGNLIVDQEPYPTSDTCKRASGNPCISDNRLEAEVAKVVADNHLPSNATTIYFVFFPQGVVSCIESDKECSDEGPPYGICAYHHWTPAHLLYASIPWVVGKECQSDGNTAVQEPNQNPSDVLLKTVSHEHNETITDPFGESWHTGNEENGDKCNAIGNNANAFLPTLGGSAEQGTLYNQGIAGHNYYLQAEWSNAGERCSMGFNPFQPEEVFIGVANGRVQRRTPTGVTNGTLQTGIGSYTTGMAFDRQDNLYVTDFGAAGVSRFDAFGDLEGTFGSGFASSPESIVFNKAGDAYVGQVDGNVIEFDEHGNIVQEFATGRSDWIDLGADQCTLYYTDEGEGGGILRFNVCTNEPMPEFVPRSALEHPYAIRVLPSGGLLVADTSMIRRFNENGELIQTYTYPGNFSWFALNLDPDGTSFYSADFETASVVRFDIASGEPLLQYNTDTGPGTVFGIVVNGELTVGSGAEVFGTVKEPGGAHIGGALVQACPAAGGSCFESHTGSGGGYRLAGLSPGTYTVTAFPPSGSNLAEAGVGPIDLVAGQTAQENLTLQSPGAPPGDVSIGPIRGKIGGIPIVDFDKSFTVTFTGCPGGSAHYRITPFLSFLTGSAEGPLAEAPSGSGNYSASVTPPVDWLGPANVSLSLTCPDNKHEEADFTLYIDPSGKVITDHGAPVVGATVTLYRGEGPLGPFIQVPNESAIMSPMNRANPDITAADGSFGWDVIGGYYKIRAEKQGCTDPNDHTLPYVESSVLTIPPSMANLSLTLHCPVKPDITSEAAATFIVGEENRFDVKATAETTPAFAEEGTLPEGVTLVDNGDGTASLAGVPKAGSVGTYDFAVDASAEDATAAQQFALTVARADTSTVTAVAPETTSGTTSVTATATVAPVAPNTLTPRGTVSFFIDADPNPAAALPLVGSKAVATISAQPVGRHTVRAVYSGDADFGPSASQPGGFEVMTSPGLTASLQLPTGSAGGGVLAFTAGASPPLLSALTVLPRKFRAASSGATISRAPVGAIISYKDSQDANSVFVVQRVGAGVRRGHGCATSTTKTSRGKRCIRYVAVGTFSSHDRAGVNRLRFTGRLNGQKLRPGRYRILLRSQNSSGLMSNEARAGFVVLP